MSNVQRRKLSRSIWNKFRELGGYEIDITPDPLASHYEVNKFGFVVEGETDTLIGILRRLIAKLTEDAFTISKESYGHSVSKIDGDVHVVIYDIQKSPRENGESFINIRVFNN